MAQIHRSVQYYIRRRYGGYQCARVSMCVCVWDEERGEPERLGCVQFIYGLLLGCAGVDGRWSPRLADATL